MHFDWFDFAHHKFAQYKQKGFSLILILVGILILMGVAGGAYYFGRQTLSLRGVSETSDVAILPTLSPAPSITESTSSADMANWKTYITSQYGFSIKYPDNWETYNYGSKPEDEPIEPSGERFFRPIGQTAAEISLEISPRESTRLDLIEDTIKNYSWDNKTVEKVSVGGVDITKVTGSQTGKKNIAVAFQKGNNIFKIQTLGNYADILEQMLSTFKFIP